MRKFVHLNARTINEAISVLQRYGAKATVIAGGTDLLGKMKDDILATYPEAIINLKTIPGLDFIKEEGGRLRIGALTRIEDIATDSFVRSQYRALAEAAHRTASPHIREMGTIGGNICQDIRCWYYRNPHNRFPCLRKGGGRCYAIEGDNRYHSIFDSIVKGGCLAVHPSDIAPALIALDAVVKTSKRLVRAEDFFEVGVTKTTILEADEIVTEVEIKAPPADTKSSFIKFASRKTIDFPIVNCAAMITPSGGKVSHARICLNAVYVTPYRAVRAEESIRGREIDETTAKTAGDAVASDAKPLRHNGYMVQIARTLVARSILACR